MHVLVLDESDERAEGVKAALRNAGYDVTVIVAPGGDPLAQLGAEVTALKAKLAERKVVERAKGILMRTRGLDEETAYATLRKLAMDRNLKLGELARRVLDSVHDDGALHAKSAPPV